MSDPIKDLADQLREAADLIEAAYAENTRLREALENIQHVGIDFGYYESAARTMQSYALKALGL